MLEVSGLPVLVHLTVSKFQTPHLLSHAKPKEFVFYCMRSYAPSFKTACTGTVFKLERTKALIFAYINLRNGPLATQIFPRRFSLDNRRIPFDGGLSAGPEAPSPYRSRGTQHHFSKRNVRLKDIRTTLGLTLPSALWPLGCQ